MSRKQRRAEIEIAGWDIARFVGEARVFECTGSVNPLVRRRCDGGGSLETWVRFSRPRKTPFEGERFGDGGRRRRRGREARRRQQEGHREYSRKRPHDETDSVFAAGLTRNLTAPVDRLFCIIMSVLPTSPVHSA